MWFLHTSLVGNTSQRMSKVSLGVWRSDEEVTACVRCESVFTWRWRRHHCRCCGNIFCGNCCEQWICIPQIHPTQDQRTCVECHQMLYSRLPRTNRRAGEQRGRALPLVGGASVVRPRRVASPPSAPAAAAAPGARDTSEPPAAPTSRRPSSSSSSASDDDRVSGAVADVLSSWDENRTTSSVSFLPALHDNLVDGAAPNVLTVLLYPSANCYTVNVITVGQEETMQSVASRLSEEFLRLSFGPFKPYGDVDKEVLLQSLRFFAGVEEIVMDCLATDVISHSSRVVLTTMTPSKLQEVTQQVPYSLGVSSLKDFFDVSDGTPLVLSTH